jgi:peptide deformylase
MAKVTDYLLQESFPDDNKAMLHKSAENVSMRLFRSSPFYRQIIHDIVNYMDGHLSMTFEDYTNIRGVSAVQLALPFTIIGFKHRSKNKFCINPKIITRSEAGELTETNCGSFRLEKGVKVFRHTLIDLEYHDLKGQKIIEKNIGKWEGGWVIQHEVDHCDGICVPDRAVVMEVKS